MIRSNLIRNVINIGMKGSRMVWYMSCKDVVNDPIFQYLFIGKKKVESKRLFGLVMKFSTIKINPDFFFPTTIKYSVGLKFHWIFSLFHTLRFAETGNFKCCDTATILLQIILEFYDFNNACLNTWWIPKISMKIKWNDVFVC